MNYKGFFLKLMPMSIVLASLCVSIACNETDPDVPTPNPSPGTVVPAGDDGEIIFDVTNAGGGSDGTSSAEPAEVKADKPLEMTITQNSSYLDPNGTTFNCNPKATIKASLQLDTVYATNLESLTKLIGNPVVKSSTTASNPKTHITDQSFNIGGQQVLFNINYEVYTHTNSKNQLIEMPYAKINNVQYGYNSTIESRSGEKDVRLADISVVPVEKPLSRSITVTDSTAYEVTARFHVDMEGKNTAVESKQTISIEVKYTAILTESTIYDGADLKTSITQNGEETTSTYFNIAPNEKLNLVITQHSSYTDQNGAQVATITSKVDITSPDTVEIDSADILTDEKIKELIPIVTEGFDRLAAPMPYYEFGEITLTNTNVSTISNEELKQVYKVTATFTQKATPVNVETANNKPSEKTFTYSVTFYAKVNIKLIDTEYRKYYTWITAHDNIPLTYYFTLCRDRKYSNGKTITDTFYSPGHMPELGTEVHCPNRYGTVWGCPSSDIFIQSTDSTVYLRSFNIVEFADMSKLSWNYDMMNFMLSNVDIDNLEKYKSEESKYFFKECKDEGFYYYKYKVSGFGPYAFYDGYCVYCSNMECWLYQYFFYIDKKIFEFKATPTNFKSQLNGIKEGYNEERGNYKVVSHTQSFDFLGKHIYVTFNDTICNW